MKLLNKKQFRLSLIFLFFLWILSPLILNYTYRPLVEYKFSREYSKELEGEVLKMDIVMHHYGSTDEWCGMWGFGVVREDREELEKIMIQRDLDIRQNNIFNQFHFFRWTDEKLWSLHPREEDRLVTKDNPYETAPGIEWSDYLYADRYNGEFLLKNKHLLKDENSYLFWKEGKEGRFLYCNSFLFFNDPLQAVKDLFSGILD